MTEASYKTACSPFFAPTGGKKVSWKIRINYSTFGMVQPGRSYQLTGDSSYRYAYNGKLLDNDIYGKYNSYDYGARFYDPRLGRWFKPDNLALFYASNSSYSYGLNNPIANKDVNGDFVIKGTSDERAVLQSIVSAAEDALCTNPFLLKQLEDNSGLTEQQIFDLFVPGQGPVLQLASMPEGVNGLTDAHSYYKGDIFSSESGTISLSDVFLKDPFITPDDAHQFFEIVDLLHEIVHYGDKRNKEEGASIVIKNIFEAGGDALQRIKDAQNAYKDLSQFKYGLEPGKVFEVRIANYSVNNDNMLSTRLNDFNRNTKRYEQSILGKGNSKKGAANPSKKSDNKPQKEKNVPKFP